MTRQLTENHYRQRARKGRLMIWLASRASRNSHNWLDRLCRALMNRSLKLEPERDFMRDQLIDNDSGFSADELKAYESSSSGIQRR